MLETDCPEPHELADWIDGQLVPDRRAALARHLRGCARCRAVVQPAPGEAASVLAGPDAWFTRRHRILPRERRDARTSLAAGTESAPGADLPSVVLGAERNVLHFRADRITGQVTAYLVCQKAEDQAFRALLIADQVFATDARGMAVLTPLRATDLFGAFVELPDLVAEWAIEVQVDALERTDHAMRPLGAPVRGSAGVAAGTYAVLPGEAGPRLLLEFSQPGWTTVVAHGRVLFHGAVDPARPLEVVGLPAAGQGTLEGEVHVHLFA